VAAGGVDGGLRWSNGPLELSSGLRLMAFGTRIAPFWDALALGLRLP